MPSIQYLVASFVQQKFVIEAIRGGMDETGSGKVLEFWIFAVEQLSFCL